MNTRRELIEAVAARYRAAGRHEKEILDEFVKVTSSSEARDPCAERAKNEKPLNRGNGRGSTMKPFEKH